MYQGLDSDTLPLFDDILPFGGKLDENNRWLRISRLLPWEQFEVKYREGFSRIGRPSKPARLVVGLVCLKHLSDAMSDEEVVARLSENVYWQAFCGFEQFAVRKALDPSLLSKQRKRLGASYFREIEGLTYREMIQRRIIRGKGLIVDGTVFPEKIKYPNDIGLLNDVRSWAVDTLKAFGKQIGIQYRTYCRTARKVYLGFSKLRRKSRKAIRQTKKKMLQYVRRNIKQVKDVLERASAAGHRIRCRLNEQLLTAEKILAQQYQMYREKSNRIKDRIVSFHRPYVRPIKRGKSGTGVEFGPKAALSHVDGFIFMDHLSHDNFSEADKDLVKGHVKSYQEKFSKAPPSFTADQLYGSREVRAYLSEQGIRAALKPLGRPSADGYSNRRWYKRKHKERNRIEGHFGHGKEHFSLDGIRYQGEEGSETWIRCALMALNLKTALARM